MELGTPDALRDELNSLVLAGKKTATTGLLSEYVEETEGLEFAGERLALLDRECHCVGVIEITDVEVTSFADVRWEHAAAEGEGDASLDAWRAGHRRFWERAGTPVEDATPVVCLAFRLVGAGG
ncbi:ASCH domain-containing protein [Actinacidiphila glaucinigra]|uniref:ASCH domain-containing protein n=1 Tax=Actinacidiphila glaucinigra TaxID=235986 RepID=UPI0029B26ED0|nr:ASCH domain-containing protein [Streptomyces sp. PA03-3a]